MKNKEIKFIDNYYSLYNSLLISNLIWLLLLVDLLIGKIEYKAKVNER